MYNVHRMYIYVYRIYYRPWKMSALTCTLYENTICVSSSRATIHVQTWLYMYAVFLVMMMVMAWRWWWQWWPDDDHRQRPDHKQSDHYGSRRRGRHHGPLGTRHTWALSVQFMVCPCVGNTLDVQNQSWKTGSLAFCAKHANKTNLLRPDWAA